MSRSNQIYHDDCFNILHQLDPHSVDLIIADLPYGETSHDWDVPIDLERFWKESWRVLYLKLFKKD